MAEKMKLSGEDCFKLENYTIHFRVVDRNEYMTWVNKGGVNDPDQFSGEIEEEMQTSWSKKEGGWDVFSGWTYRDHEWNRFLETFIAVYRKEPVISEGIYAINGDIFVTIHENEKDHEITIDGIKPFFPNRNIDIVVSQEYEPHSDGYEWGYGGCGPAQTSLAILLEVLPSDISGKNYQQFKNDVISNIKQGNPFRMKIDVRKEKIIYSVDVLDIPSSSGGKFDGVLTLAS
jgi:hypothetical protein